MMHCNEDTRGTCYNLGILAGPRSLFSEMQEHIGPNTTIVLYDVGTRCLHGIFQPTSSPEMNIAPEAFQGRFPAQVRVHSIMVGQTRWDPSFGSTRYGPIDAEALHCMQEAIYKSAASRGSQERRTPHRPLRTHQRAHQQQTDNVATLDIDEAAHGTKKKKMKELGRPVQLFKVATTALQMRY